MTFYFRRIEYFILRLKSLFYFGKINLCFFNFVDWIVLERIFCSTYLIVIANVITAILFVFSFPLF